LQIVFAVVVTALMYGCDQWISDPPESTVKSVAVTFNGEEAAVVDLANLEVIERDGEQYALLADVVEAAELGVELETLEFDFEAADGFRSSSTSTCVDVIPMDGALLRQGFVHRLTRNLDWDVEPELPGCVGRLRDLARILAVDGDDETPPSGP
jgi:hypothetical protein